MINFEDPAIEKSGEAAKSAIAQIATQPGLKPFIDFLETIYKSEVEDLVNANIDIGPCEAAKNQGRASTLKCLLFMFKSAQGM